MRPTCNGSSAVNTGHATDYGKLLIQGENVALIEARTLQLIRIGRAGRHEETWWRYGREYGRRRQHARKVVRKDTGATEAQVADANRVIELAGSVERALADSRMREPLLGSLEPARMLALEIALNESSERVLLELEVAEVEAQWREAEQIAAIVDSELT